MTVRAALDLYGEALHGRGGPLRAVEPCGTATVLPVPSWCADELPGDRGLVARCRGATLDVGCGPGRLTVAVAAAGLPALGVDVAPGAVAVARARGALVLGRSVFDALPGPGRWETVLLADGNVGIGGDPVVLLDRVATLLGPSGHALVEVDAPGVPSRRTSVRLENASGSSTWFPWAHLGRDDVEAAAAPAGLALLDAWVEADRWFVALGVGGAPC